VVFLLLVFFLLTSVFIDPGIPLRLPEAGTSEQPRNLGIVVSIAQDGSVHVDDQRVDLEALQGVLSRGADESSNPRVLIRGDIEARYGVFVQVVDACRSAGLMDVTLGAGLPVANSRP
jgi:biopolymer transport protein ExbD